MPTVVDELILKLSIDPTGVKRGRAEADAELKKTRDAATETVGAMRAGSTQVTTELKRTGDAATKTAKTMQADGAKAGEFFSAIKIEALALIGVLLGGKGIEAFVRDTSKSLADLGRQAVSIGETASDINAFSNAIERMGGNAEAAKGALEGIARAKQEWLTKGDNPEFVSFLSYVGASADMSPLQIMSHFADFAKANESTPGGIQTIKQYGAGIGLDPATINSIIQMVRASSLPAEMTRSRELFPLDQKTIDDMTKLQTALAGFEQAVKGASTALLEKFAPSLTKVIDQISKDLTTKQPPVSGINPDLTRDLSSVGSFFSGIVPDWVTNFLLHGNPYSEEHPAGGGGSPSAPTPRAGPRADTAGPHAGVPGLANSSLADLIGRGEGGYNSVNRGAAGGYASGTEDLVDKTVAQVMADQAMGKYNAAGRYQIIGPTMTSAANQLNLTGGEKFDKALQDRIFEQFLAGSKHPEIGNFISGKSNDLHAALAAVAAEWASVADPDTGVSHYAGIAGNKATVSSAEVANALRRARDQRNAVPAPAQPPALPGPRQKYVPDPALGPHRMLRLEDMLSAGPRVAHNDNSTSVDIANINVHTQAIDAKGISASINRALADEISAQSNRGLQ